MKRSRFKEEQIIAILAEAKSGRTPKEVLLAENVLARKHFWPGRHNMGACRSLQPNAHIIRPETERGSARVMVLPTGQEVSEETVGIICHVIKTALGDAALVKTALQA